MTPRQAVFFLILLLAAGGALNGCHQPPREKPLYQDIGGPAPSGRISLPADLPPGDEGEAVRRGWRIFHDTRQALAEAASRGGGGYEGNALSCRSCHREDGTRSGAFPLREMRTATYRPREGLVLDRVERINACLRRSLNAPPLAAGSPEMTALESYLEWLGKQGPDPKPARAREKFPDHAADLAAGGELYRTRCASCHGDAGDGADVPPDVPDVPPLWGSGSYTRGSAMDRLLTSAAFLHANMPPEPTPERPPLSAREAYDTAGFIHSLDRPTPEGLDLDYPALTEKPVDCPYPPYADSFSVDQHRYGPFGPIRAERKAQRRLDRETFRSAFSPSSPSGGESGRTKGGM